MDTLTNQDDGAQICRRRKQVESIQKTFSCDNCKQLQIGVPLKLRCEHSLCKSCCLRSLSDDSGNLQTSLYCPVHSCIRKLTTRECFKMFIYLFKLGEHKIWLQHWQAEVEKYSNSVETEDTSGLVSLHSEHATSKLCYCGCHIMACVVEWSVEPSTIFSLAKFHCGLARILSISHQFDRIARNTERKVRRGTLESRTTVETKSPSLFKKRSSSRASHGVGYGGRSGEKFVESDSHKRKSDYDDSIMSSVLDCISVLLHRRLGPYPLFLWTFLHHSAFIQVVANLLRNNSIHDVCSRIDLYSSLFHFLKICVEDISLQLFLFVPIACTYDSHGTNEETQNTSLAHLLADFERNISFLQKSSLKGNVDIPRSEAHLMNLVAETCAQVRSVKTLYERFTSELEDNVQMSSPKPERNNDELTKEYCHCLRPLQFQTLEGLSRYHSLKKENSMRREWNPGKGRTFRLAKEVSSLRNDLPLFYDSSIVVRVDEENFDIFRVLIFGPENTPYANGAFFFDFLLPPEYPEKPPKGCFLNTRLGEIRCNPNLYNDGKICLSLLGTWAGPSWTSQCTLLQVGRQLLQILSG